MIGVKIRKKLLYTREIDREKKAWEKGKRKGKEENNCFQLD